MQKGLIHVYTGDGKGKTTAAIGLAVRALGHGFKVVYASFFKKPNAFGYNEIKVIKDLGATVFTFSEQMPSRNAQSSTEMYHDTIQNSLTNLLEYLCSTDTQLLVLDEILIAVYYGYISEQDLLEFVQNKPDKTELVLTGRGATEAIKQIADYVSVLEKEKHPFENGVPAREGIEF